MTRFIAAIPVVLAFSVLQAIAQDDRPSEGADSGTIALSTPGGWIMSDDQETLIVSSPSNAELIFINTSNGTVIKKVKVDFQPVPSLSTVQRCAPLARVRRSSTLSIPRPVRSAKRSRFPTRSRFGWHATHRRAHSSLLPIRTRCWPSTPKPDE